MGSDQSKLAAELKSEKFEIAKTQDRASEYRFSAEYQLRSVGCREVWTIQWNSERGKITKIRAENRDICF